jgi:CheY-like chemotaxis protein
MAEEAQPIGSLEPVQPFVPTIMVVEDDRPIAVAVVDMLKLYGYDVTSVCVVDPNRAIEAIMNQRPNFLVLDYQLGPDHPHGGPEVLDGLVQVGFEGQMVVITHSALSIDLRSNAFKRFESRFPVYHVHKMNVDSDSGIVQIINQYSQQG